MHVTFRIASLALLALTAVSCGSKSGPAGKWDLDTSAVMAEAQKNLDAEIEKAPAEQREQMKKMGESMTAMFKQMKATLDLQAGGAFVGTFDSPMGKSEVKGTWKQEGDKVSMTGTETGKTTPETKIATLKGDTLVVTEEQGPQKMEMIFRRAK